MQASIALFAHGLLTDSDIFGGPCETEGASVSSRTCGSVHREPQGSTVATAVARCAVTHAHI
jgi:hypothetical protein